MGKYCHANDVGSVVLGRPAPCGGGGGGGGGGGSQFKLWSASFCRIVLDAVRCGGGARHNKQTTTAAAQDLSQELKPKPKTDNLTWTATTLRSELKTTDTTTTESGSGKLSDLLRLSENEEEEDAVNRKVEALEELKRVVKCLQQDQVHLVLEGAREVRRLTKDDPEARTTLALLGAIPPLVALLDSSPDLSSQIAALYALLNLGIGNDANKAAIVQAGAVHKMVKLIETTVDMAVAEAVIANFLALSALDANKPIIGSSGAIPFLVRTLQDSDEEKNSSQAKQDALRAVYNLSISPSNVLCLIDSNLAVVPFLLNKLGDMDASERILSILSNIVSVSEGRKAIQCAPEAFPILVDILNWTDSPGCQEKVSYILMVMVHKSFGDRQAMIEAGIISSLLELTLLGSTLAQKRASRILECLTVDKGKQSSESSCIGIGAGGGFSPALSAPLSAAKSSPSTTDHPSHQQLMEALEEDQVMMSQERKAVKQLVQQSLQNNMKRIVKRANLPHDFVPSDHFKSLASSSTSKSLPF